MRGEHRRRRERQRARRGWGEERGFSVIETMIVVALLAVVSVAILGSMTRASETAQFSADRNEALDQLRIMAADFTKDVRQGIEATSIATSAVTFDTYVNGSQQSVTWAVVSSGGTEELQRTVGSAAPTTYVIDLTTADVFNFFGEVDPAAVDRIGLDLATQPDSRHPAVELSTVVEMRNVP